MAQDKKFTWSHGKKIHARSFRTSGAGTNDSLSHLGVIVGEQQMGPNVVQGTHFSCSC
jgi:hypothetical protein